ncbi:MAG: hypothetical protein OEX04_09025 [Acidimicrobiia bacterium]|nr:hypothetical protein [Acidimicrobiia bacterium]MDH4307606.1 hypothetical protein [Acidimicrobiia bacterium]
MDRLHQSEWLEVLDGLCMRGPVEVEPTTVLPRPVSGCRLRAADYAPFDDLVEILLEDDLGRIRVLIDHPKVIWREHDAGHGEQVAFDTAKGRITLRCER